MKRLDPNRMKVVEEVTLKKFDGDFTAEQIDAGEADDALVETITLKDGVVIEHWRRDG